LLGPGKLHLTAGTTYLDGFWLWTSPVDVGTRSGTLVVDAGATGVFRVGRDGSGGYLRPGMSVNAQVFVQGGILRIVGQQAWLSGTTSWLDDTTPVHFKMNRGTSVNVSN